MQYYFIFLGTTSEDFAEVMYDELKSTDTCNLISDLTIVQLNSFFK